MVEWTDDARQEFDAYRHRTRERVLASGADPDEVAADLRLHLSEEAAGQGLAILTGADVRRLLARAGEPIEPPLPTGGPATSGPSHPALAEPGDSTPEGPPPWLGSVKPADRIHPVTAVAFALFGVVLPSVTLLLELFTGICASVLFDPIPSVWHALLIGSVPIGNALFVLLLIRGRGGWGCWAPPVNGFVLGVSGYYALLFLPVTPFALVGIMYFGLGLLPLAPLVSLVVALLLRARARRRLSGFRWPGIVGGILVAAGAIVLLEIPKTVTVIGQHLAGDSDRKQHIRGVRLLRRFGDRELLLRGCYVRPGAGPDLVGFLYGILGEPVTTERARKTYYEVTGTPFNAVEPPALRSRRGVLAMDGEFDFGLGGDDVEARLAALTLESSRIDTSVDGDAGVAYTEWTLVFKNDSQWQEHEARAQVALPPGGVVSRLTLWVDGEEREAAFAGREQTKAAYQNVVRRRRDPVLVTTSGPDRVLVQCFPVPPDGGTMKVRLGVTAPLLIPSSEQAILRLPAFLERNFRIPEVTEHAVWIEGRGRMRATTPGADLTAENPEPRVHALRGSVADALLTAGLAVAADRDPDVVAAWTPDGDGFMVSQTLVPGSVEPPTRVVVVLDGSIRMAAHVEAVAAILAAQVQGLEVAIMLAGDEVETLLSPAAAGPGVLAAVGGRLRAADFAGGRDNLPALSEAWDLAAQKPGSVILWLHATQPVELSPPDRLIQKWERRPNGPALHALQFGPGPNRVLRALDRLPQARAVPSFGDPASDLRRLLEVWGGQAAPFGFERRRTAAPADGGPAGKQTSRHLARLWALEQVGTLRDSAEATERERATAMAAAYQLVTPVSGAVVLETQQQYEAAGLEPVDGTSVPTIPEPETWALIVVSLAVLAWLCVKTGWRRWVVRCHRSG